MRRRGPVERAGDVGRPTLPGRRTPTVVGCASCVAGSWQSLPPTVPLWYETSYDRAKGARKARNQAEIVRSDVAVTGHKGSVGVRGPWADGPHHTSASSLLRGLGRPGHGAVDFPARLGPGVRPGELHRPCPSASARYVTRRGKRGHGTTAVCATVRLGRHAARGRGDHRRRLLGGRGGERHGSPAGSGSDRARAVNRAGGPGRHGPCGDH